MKVVVQPTSSYKSKPVLIQLHLCITPAKGIGYLNKNKTYGGSVVLWGIQHPGFSLQHVSVHRLIIRAHEARQFGCESDPILV